MTKDSYDSFRFLSPKEMELFIDSIHQQLKMFSHEDLIILIQSGYVAVDMWSVLHNSIYEDDVYIFLTEDGSDVDGSLPETNLTSIMIFAYFHDFLYPSDDEDSPQKNPHWIDIISMSCEELVLGIEDYMYPMFIDLFKICFFEYQQKVYG